MEYAEINYFIYNFFINNLLKYFCKFIKKNFFKKTEK